MEIATLIVACLTLIAVGIGLFINHKTNEKLTDQIKVVEEKTKQDIFATREEILEKIKIFKDDIFKHLDNSAIEIKNSILEKTEQVNTDVALRIEGTEKSVNSNMTTVKTDLIEIFEASLKSVQSEVQTILAKTEIEVKSKIDSSLKIQQDQQLKSFANTEEKFQEVINEIKKPLSLD